MDNLTILEVVDAITSDVIEYVLIENFDGSFTSMPKSVYDEMIAAQNEAAL